MTGYKKLFWGFLFLFDLRIMGVDLLPDFIGYIFFYLGLKQLMFTNEHFNIGKKYSIPLIFLSIFSIYENQVQVNQQLFNTSDFILMIIGLIVLVLNLLLVYHIAEGIAELARESGNLELESQSTSRWKYYLYVNISVYLTIILMVLAPMLAVLLVFILFIAYIVVLILMMQLMSKAEKEGLA